jgi:hypothetical protein
MTLREEIKEAGVSNDLIKRFSEEINLRILPFGYVPTNISPVFVEVSETIDVIE